jgi:hypothetical protein
MKSATASIVCACILSLLLGLPAASAGSTPDALSRVAVQMPAAAAQGHEDEYDIVGARVAAASPECSVSTLARLEGRRAARMSRSDQEGYLRWCESAAGLDASATAQIQSSPVMDMVSAGGPSEIWCPPGSTQCYCWNGKHYNGCQNFASHCTSGLTCGPAGKVCHCDAN